MIFIFLPSLTMHYCTYVIIGPTGDIEPQVALALEPFNESLEVERYKEYLDKIDIERMAKFYKIKDRDFPTMLEKMEHWRGTEGGIDEVGLFSWTTANPNRKFDWYEIGGRWSGRLHGWNVIETATLLKAGNLEKLLPFNIVTPEGAWLEVETLIQCGDFKFEPVRKSDSRWLIELKQVLLRYPDHRVVCVDIHQ